MCIYVIHVTITRSLLFLLYQSFYLTKNSLWMSSLDLPSIPVYQLKTKTKQDLLISELLSKLFCISWLHSFLLFSPPCLGCTHFPSYSRPEKSSEAWTQETSTRGKSSELECRWEHLSQHWMWDLSSCLHSLYKEGQLAGPYKNNNWSFKTKTESSMSYSISSVFPYTQLPKLFLYHTPHLTTKTFQYI